MSKYAVFFTLKGADRGLELILVRARGSTGG
jgi:hypothetical protein